MRSGDRGRHQRGLSLVELMVGITVGLLVVAGATLMVTGQMAENRRLIAETQVQQDIRATADIIGRELRRAGGLAGAGALGLVWDPASTAEPPPNTYAATLTPLAGAASDTVTFDYQNPDPLGGTGNLGFRFNATNGTIESLLRNGTWQDLTDRNTMRVTTFNVQRLDDLGDMVACPNACPDGTTNCWPRVSVRTLEITIVAEATGASEVVRRHQSRVRLRNDHLPFYDPATSRQCPP